ncbi:saccharopine dehydrogenase [Halopseudomonas pachastrellae]|uniref:Saccharopine dehydrogenase n=1 Tax=Halopseudomonas pachastrellae TaxID=254161 RepID=A0A1S8DI72_9GAMM|nr:saccharopine dehydrogenase NADP-binding domain-containing protein [Halopseudomonas pachastrellae]ONM45125.1 saccharopine dehydrogenase [Halopseudomonas pachastrellae]SFM55047.1 Saccharopine dehydrogenase NADP binding domain-containing protein [Halopseudomonas pachastrellae]
MSCQRILILGGYGNFGKRITETLADTADITLIIAGRRSAPAQQLQTQLQPAARARLETAELDLHAADFETKLAALKPDLVIHTGGPFQGQDYRVPRACIAAGCHYIDLADDRRFVCDISQLDDAARAAGVLLVSGASSVPGLSSCVIAHYADQFSRLDDIDFAIAPGNQAERGEATVRGILSYTGHPIRVWQAGRWQQVYGWMSLRRLYFDATIGRRPLANVDIPDLELLPAAYPTLRSVHFQAGLELGLLHYGMWLMAGLARIGLVRDWSRWSKPIVRASEWFIRWGTDTGGMQINLRGLDHQQQPLHLKWVLGATEGIGPYIPTLSALILARRLVSGELSERGAIPCMNLFPLSAFEQEAQGLAIYHQLETHRG